MSDRKLRMKLAGRFIDLLGHEMYGGPVPAIAELISNSWDADSDRVEVEIPEDPRAENAQIIVRDFGIGMTFEEINEYYLTIGFERRQRGIRTPRNRLVMGRKGIGIERDSPQKGHVDTLRFLRKLRVRLHVPTYIHFVL